MAIIDPFDPKPTSIIDPFDTQQPKVAETINPALDNRKKGTPEYEAAFAEELAKREKQAADEMGVMGRGVAAFDRGVTRLGQGVNQILQHGDPFSMENNPDIAKAREAERAATDAEIRDQQERWDRSGISSTPEGFAGEMIGQAAATAPVLAIGGPAGAGAKGVSTLAGPGALAQAALQSFARGTGAAAAQGAIAGVLNPTTDMRSDIEGLVTGKDPKSFAEAKLEQAATGAAWGAGMNLGLKGLGTLAERLWPANIRAQALGLITGKARNSPAAQEGVDLAQRTGVEFTPGQEIESGGLKQIENAARQSFWSRDIAAESDKKRVQQLADYFGKTVDDITKADNSPIEMASRLRDTVRTTKSGLEKVRRETAAKDYAAVDQLSGGSANITTDSYRQALGDLIEENSVAPKGSGQRAIADSLASLREQIGEGGDKVSDILKTRRYLSQVAGGQTSLGQLDKPMQKRAAAMLLGALDRDLDNAAEKIGGNVGEALRTANSRYKAFSQELEAVDKSPLGKLLGEEFASDATGAFNSIPAEQVVERMSKLKPTQIVMVKNYLASESPETLAMWKRSVLEDALEKSKSFPGSAGADNPVLRPEVLVKELEKSAPVKSLFDKGEAQKIADGIAAARKLGDKTGYNFSGTAAQSEVLNFFNRPIDALKQGGNEVLGAVAKTGVGALGMRGIAKVMADPKAREALFTLQRLPPGAEKARKAAAYLMALYNSQDGE